jgi:predicted metal-dependent peptidase
MDSKGDNMSEGSTHEIQRFLFEKSLIIFLSNNVFYSEISRRVHKQPSDKIPTACVSYNKTSDDLEMLYNEEWMATLSPKHAAHIIKHELNHLVFGHLFSRQKKIPLVWNYATDCAINSIICEEDSDTSEPSLPPGALIPGELNLSEKPSDEEVKFGKLIQSLPKLKSSEWYYHKLLQNKDSLPSEDYVVVNSGDHSQWGNMSEEEKEYIKGKINKVVSEAVRAADQTDKGWGNLPSNIIEAIRKSISNTIPWNLVLKQFVGTLIRSGRSTSIKRINKRYPYIHPGVKKNLKPKLLCAIDQSGSVSNKDLEQFYAELDNLVKIVDVDIIPFDTDVNPKQLETYRKGGTVTPIRKKSGGTDFNAVTNYVNDPKNKLKWDGVLIITDGQCSKPNPTRIKRGWVLGKNNKLYFDTDEVKITIGNGDEIAKPVW